MITINQLKIEIALAQSGGKAQSVKIPDSMDILRAKAAKILNVNAADIAEIRILKHSIDARKKTRLFQVYTLGVELGSAGQEERAVKYCRSANVTPGTPEYAYAFPAYGTETLSDRPVVVGMGPAGLFCGYMLAKHGYHPLILERGFDVERRTRDVETFWSGGSLNPESNVQFGEGGAGAFSDGKLNTLVKDRGGRNREVLRIFVSCGASERILYESKPHIGTDVLKNVVMHMRQFIIANGGEVRFGAKVTGLGIAQGHLCAVTVNDTDVIKTTQAVLAIGHSARDTFAYLDSIHIPMEAKAFAVGLRVEHPQSFINESMYGMYGRMLPAAPYKLTAQTSTGRGVYSFCMCPGGYVVNASSEEGRLAVNGMSYADRSGRNANSAIIVQVTPDDFGCGGALAGVAFQRRLEEQAYQLGGGKIPVQYYRDYAGNVSLAERTDAKNYNSPCIKGEYRFSNLRGLLPGECEKAFLEGMEQFGRVIHGFDADDAILSGVESRTSSPVRICRDETMQSLAVRGLYPCGEGAGYAGGITSAAMDGIRAAEQIAMRYRPFSKEKGICH